MTVWQQFVETFCNPQIFAQYWASIARGMLVTVEIAAAVVTGLGLGVALAGLRAYGLALVNAPIVIFVDLLRALPPLAAVLLVYFRLPSVVVLWLVLALVLAAFAEEIVWAGITSTPRGQWSALDRTGILANAGARRPATGHSPRRAALD
jgi:polar amino acid transport system permease protein